jgi:hypothetical protein
VSQTPSRQPLTLARAPVTSAGGPHAGAQPLSAAPVTTAPLQPVARLARAIDGGMPSPAGAVSGGGGGGGGAGGDAGAVYDEVLRRVRQEQEQLGQLIPHPF